jgi:hypothetical protein
MKNTLLLLGAAGAACVLSGCAGAVITHTDIASGAYKPKAIYIRSYIAENAPYIGHHGDSVGEHPIRRSLAPAAFSAALKEEMEKLAPAMVLANNERPTTGWLVESNIEYANAGSPALRGVFGIFDAGHSCVKIHVRITDVGGHYAAMGDKDMGSNGVGAGNVIYEFDVKASSGDTGAIGSTYAPGLGSSEQFDYKNAAERIAYALAIDPQRYGTRTSPTITE